MPALGPALLQALWAGWVLTLQPLPPTAFTPNGTYLQHLARDPTSGTLYLGATNFLFQLSPGLQLEATVSTGPVLDSRDCLPPVMPDECPQAQPTNNPNQLLLVSPGALVVCGSVHQGVCEQRRLGQLEQLLLRPERPGDTQYVAANDPAVSTVGLVAQGLAGEPLLFVGRGYTSRGVGGGIPPITTRALWPPDPQAAFSYEETAKLAVGRLSEYSHHFVSAFARGASAYFLFLRRDLQAQSRAFRAYVSRVCLRDQHYYSYVELPLACEGSRYGLMQAAAVATSREVAHGEVLFAAFSSAAPPTVGRPPSAAAGASGASALCAFPLDEVDRLANRTRDACYTREGRAEDGTEVAYIEYDVNSDCAQLPVDTLDAYPCGSDHTPSPMASRVPLEATPILEWPGIQLTAVAVTMEDGHTIAFLGDSQGQLHRVYLGPGSDGHPYSTQSIQQGSAVSRDLTFDGTFEHLYVMTQSTVFLSVPDLPPLWPGESYSCHFGEHQSPALLTGSGVMCPSPDPSEAPVLPRGADYVSVSVELRFGAVVIAKTSLSFYDCVAVTELRPSAQCQACVSSRWECNWCVWQHLCTHKASCDAGPMVASHQSPLVSPDPPARGGPSPSPPTAPKALATPAPDTLPVEPGAPSTATASDISPGASPSLLSPWGPWAGSGPISSPGSTGSPLHEEPSPPSPQNGPGTAVPAPTDFRPSATPEDLLASPLSPSEVAAVPPADPGPEALHPTVPLDLPPATVPATTFPGAMGSVKPALDWLTREGGELPEADEWTGGDAPAFSTSTLLSGDGDSAELEGPPAPLILPSSLDYQYDTPGLWELEEATLGASSCPCVQSVQGSTLMPVHVEREIRLLGRNLHLFQDGPGDNECVMELEGLEVVVEARVECEPPPDTQCHVTCQQHQVEPLTGPVDGGTRVTIRGSNLGQHVQDVLGMVTVAGVPCAVDAQEYEVSSSLVCITGASGEEVAGATAVEVPGRGRGVSEHDFAYQDPKVHSIFPARGPRAGGTRLTLNGSKLLTGRLEDIRVVVGDQPCHLLPEQQSEQLRCETSPRPTPATLPVAVWFGATERRLQHGQFKYTLDPNITSAGPTKSFLSGGREIWVRGQNLDVVQTPRIRVTVVSRMLQPSQGLGRRRRVVPETACSLGPSCSSQQFEEPCLVNSSQLITCRTPALPGLPEDPWVRVEFILDNLVFDFATLNPTPFSYEADPTLQPLNPEDPTMPFRHKPGSVFSVEGENLDLAMSKEEVVAMIGDGPCVVKTLTRHHLYCEPPVEQPLPRHHALREAPDSLPEFTVQMGNLRFSLGYVQYDGESPGAFPVAAQVGLGVGTSLLALGVIIIVLMYRRKSKQALRDYKKVQIQLENLESSVRDRCKKEFTDLMTEMTDLTSDLLGSGIPFLDYKVYAERIFFPGHRESPLHRDLGVPESRRPTVEQGLGQLSNLLNSKLFLTKFIHTLESQRTFSARDRAYVASLLTVALHGKLEYFTDILRTLLSDLVAQYVAKNPKLMLRRTETVVEKLLTNWMSICLYTFVRDSVGEPLYMLFRGIKHQVDKGPVDSVTGKAKYTLNDNRLLREDVEYRPLTLNALLAVGPGAGEAQGVPVKVLDCDTISQAKEKMLDQLYKGVPLTQRPDPRTLDVEWRSGVAGHLILSDEDVTSEVHGLWRRLNTLQHYKVPDGATVALVPCLTKHVLRENQDYVPGERTPMLEDVDEGGIRPWHLVKPSDEPEPPRPRRGSLRGGERERAKAIPEIYLTRLLSMKGTLQKFVDDLFQVILSTSRPVPLAVKYFFDLLDEQAQQHGISDQDTIHIWKTNSLPLRFWINIIKNPQFVFDVQTSDNMDAVLLVIAQTFMDACTLADHKLGRDSPINKLLYARDIPRYKRMVERYYADIRQTVPASDQEMNSVLAELSWGSPWEPQQPCELVGAGNINAECSNCH
ncbi:PLXNB1 isoform 5 [Pan troglodytes]|uniref:PLXNB1 isoform 5 n=1 Tax=Pan troglodytes TaxID=9598 RepID=A0A2J8PA05_PANTR|nr:PLXNB1 isoform 5 [Pan troglodytes]